MPTQNKTRCQDVITCPHCEYKFRDSRDLHIFDKNDLECRDCGRFFFLRVHNKVTYTTTK